MLIPQWLTRLIHTRVCNHFSHIFTSTGCCFSVVAILMRVGGNHNMILTCISLMASEAEHFFHVFIGHFTSSENHVFFLLAHLLTDCLILQLDWVVYVV